VTGSHSSLEFGLLEQADPGALVQAIGNLRDSRTTTTTASHLYGNSPFVNDLHGLPNQGIDHLPRYQCDDFEVIEKNTMRTLIVNDGP
jgi:hypothetical protein